MVEKLQVIQDSKRAAIALKAAGKKKAVALQSIAAAVVILPGHTIRDVPMH